MSELDRKSHWNRVYSEKQETEVSWFQEMPEPSLDLLRMVGARRESAILDIGGGASRLVDALVADGYTDLTVLDLSSAALETARRRLGGQADAVTWIAEDVTRWEPQRLYDIWHDRAALHFLTDTADQDAYADRLRRALGPGGHAIIGTFAPDGPEKCSGLTVVRHDSASLSAMLGPRFELVDSRSQEHRTPWDAAQKFQFSTFRFV